MTRAVLIATGYNVQMDPLIRYRPTSLLNIADKPIIFYILECLIEQGIQKFDLILNHLPASIEEKLGDGKRWGVSITFHLARNYNFPFPPLLPCLEAWDNTPIILGLGDSIPQFQKNIFHNQNASTPHLFFYPDGLWSGWAILSPHTLKKFNKKKTLEEIPTYLKDAQKVIVEHFLSSRSFHDLQTSNSKILRESQLFHLLPITAHKIAPGIWISKNVSLHPHVKLNPPVFIGENCQIDQDVQLGPDTVIENQCMVSVGSKIERSIICQRSFIGEKLEIEDSIVDRNLLINLSYSTYLYIREDFILSELITTPILQYPLRFLEKCMALFIFLLLFPIYLYLKFTCHIIKKRMVNLPASDDPTQWKTFDWKTFAPLKKTATLNRFQNFFKRLPLLINIIRGEAYFVGVVPRSINDLKKLPHDWQKLYLKSKVGLITLTDLEPKPIPTEDDLYAAETFYSMQMNFWFDLKLFFRWLNNKMFKQKKMR